MPLTAVGTPEAVVKARSWPLPKLVVSNLPSESVTQASGDGPPELNGDPASVVRTPLPAFTPDTLQGTWDTIILATKAHHTAAFMAANMSAIMDDTDKVRHFYDEGVALGLAVVPPDVNASNYRFEPVDGEHIRYGLGGIKGTGRPAIEASPRSWRPRASI